MTLFFTLFALQTSPVKDPHRGQFTDGAGRRCASCHDKTPRAEDMHRAAARMEKLATDLSKGPLNFTCHQGAARVKR